MTQPPASKIAPNLARQLARFKLCNSMGNLFRMKNSAKHYSRTLQPENGLERHTKSDVTTD
ncbi:MAG: pseudouridine synthase, partial [Cupriavidus sp.]|nr:pseudouridine synthase [Cupriavidus sp.]